MVEYNKAMQKAGVLLALNGLFPPSTGARVSYAADVQQRDDRVRQIHEMPDLPEDVQKAAEGFERNVVD